MMPVNSSSSLLFDSLPERIRTALAAYAAAAKVSTRQVILFTIAHLLEVKLDLSEAVQPPFEVSSILDELPSSLQEGIRNYAAQEEGMPPEFVVELAITFFLDPDAITFDDCMIGIQREQLDLLQRQNWNASVVAA